MKTLRSFYRLSRPFWGSRGQWLAWLMLAALIGLGLLVVQINVLINSWSKTFYDTLTAFDTHALYGLVGQYALYLGAYVVILWNLSGMQTFSLFGQTFTVQGYLVWIVLAYTLLGSLLTHWIGKPLHALNYERQHREADFRASLLRKRDHAEQIALYRGEAVERQQLGERFRAIAENWRQLMGRERNLSLFTVAFLIHRLAPRMIGC